MEEDNFEDDDVIVGEDTFDEEFLELPCRVYHKEYYDIMDTQVQDDVVLMQCGICGKLYIFGMDGTYKGQLVDREL